MPPDQALEYLAPPPQLVEYNQPLAASYFIQPPEFVDDPLPEINELENYDLSYLEGVREKLVKSIRSVTGQINLDEGRRDHLKPDQSGVLEYRKAYKQPLLNYKDAFMPYLKQRRQQGRGEIMQRGRQARYGLRGQRCQRGRGIWGTSPIFFYNTPQDLLKRFELLEGSLKAGNNGVLTEYIQIAHRLRDTGVISNTQLKKLLRKYIDL